MTMNPTRGTVARIGDANRGLLQRHAVAAARIAQDLISMRVGDRMPTTVDWQVRCGVGSGTVQKGLRELVSAGAVTLRSSGHLGTFIEELDRARLWELAGLGAVAAVAPLPTSLEFAGLAAGLRAQFERLRVPFQPLYLHGSTRRAQMVLDGGADIAVLSGRAAAQVRDANPTRLTVRQLTACQYYSPQSVVVVARPDVPRERWRRIAIDRLSPDHMALTDAEFSRHDQLEYVNWPYPSIPEAVADGRIDAAVWHRTAMARLASTAGLSIGPLRDPGAQRLSRDLDDVALVHRSGSTDAPLHSVLAELDGEAVAHIQDDVITGRALPSY